MEVVKQEIDKGADAIIVKMTGNSNEYSQLKKIQKKDNSKEENNGE